MPRNGAKRSTARVAAKTKERPSNPPAVAIIPEDNKKKGEIIQSYLLQAGNCRPVLPSCRKINDDYGLRGVTGTPRRGVGQAVGPDGHIAYCTTTPKRRPLHQLPIRVRFTIKGEISPIYQIHASEIGRISSKISFVPKKVSLAGIINAVGGPPHVQDENSNIIIKTKRVSLQDIDKARSAPRDRFELVMGGELSNDCALSSGLPVSDEQQYEYGHLIGHLFGGSESPDNVALVSRACNRFMATIERKIKTLIEKKNIDFCDIEVKVHYMSRTEDHPNTYLYLADVMEYGITLNGNNIYFRFDALSHDFWPKGTSTYICNLIQGAAVPDELSTCIDFHLNESVERNSEDDSVTPDDLIKKSMLIQQLLGEGVSSDLTEEDDPEIAEKKCKKSKMIEAPSSDSSQDLVPDRVQGDGGSFYDVVGAQVSIDDTQMSRGRATELSTLLRSSVSSSGEEERGDFTDGSESLSSLPLSASPVSGSEGEIINTGSDSSESSSLLSSKDEFMSIVANERYSFWQPEHKKELAPTITLSSSL